MKTEVDIARLRADAERLFQENTECGFFCSEAIVSSVRTHLDPDMPASLIAAASGFPVGVGRSKCMCGAISGGIICLGYFFGRDEPTSPDDRRTLRTMELARELHESFVRSNRAACCSTLTKGMDLDAGEHRDQCIRLTGEMAQATAEIITRELARDASNNC